jgi:acyl-homoserine lactone acylase PvdQ
MLYAQAEDDFPRIERNYVWAIGRLAEVEGEDAIFSDLRARLYMTVDEAKAAYASAPAWLQELCDAWADGLNYYLMTHPGVEPKLLTRFEPWMPMFFSEGSIGGDIEQVPVEGIAAFYGSDAETVAAARAIEARFAPAGGSNGFAIAGERTRSGNAMLLINPHTSFYFRGEVHVVSEEGTARRAAIMGYRVSGKTGTSWKASQSGGYSTHKYMAVFGGVVPASRPRLAAVVVIDEPGGRAYYGGEVAAPVFSNVMSGALRLLALPPDDLQRMPATTLVQAQDPW